jgi:hypothetical protein
MWSLGDPAGFSGLQGLVLSCLTVRPRKRSPSRLAIFTKRCWRLSWKRTTSGGFPKKKVNEIIRVIAEGFYLLDDAKSQGSPEASSEKARRVFHPSVPI